MYWLLNISSCSSFQKYIKTNFQRQAFYSLLRKYFFFLNKVSAQKFSKHSSMLTWKHFYFFFTPISQCCFSAVLRRLAVAHLQKVAAGVAGLGARLLLPVAHPRGDCHREVHRLAGHRNFLRQGFPLESENGAAARAQDRQAGTAVHRSCLFCCALDFIWNVFCGLFLAVVLKLFFSQITLLWKVINKFTFKNWYSNWF